MTGSTRISHVAIACPVENCLCTEDEGAAVAWRSYVAMGYSFTEGMNDAYPDGTFRGWADLVAARLALDSGPDFGYANLAIRGRLLDQVVAEQLEPTLAMRPDLVSFAAGGNDVLRPR